MHCSACGSENAPGQRFCTTCGTPLAAACAACGASNPAGSRFCGSCGSALGAEIVAAPHAPLPVAERRLVSVLFADLVSFTTISEARDSEDVRELLSRYFDVCRRLIEVYGGTVEKFIGDAVMAVWGAPVATEQDAERAVRAGLDLVAAVSALGDELGIESLRARVGILTGEAAVTIGAVGEGMVAGDLVNTAARVQSVAEPGSVFVGEVTRAVTEAAVVYEPAGSFELKGKAGETTLWRALRVVSGSQGSRRSERLEAPFVGRERELRLVKDAFHASAEEGRAHLVSITGIGGIGKSRLAWEFFKYVDGLPQEIWWHQGRCLAYGEGVAYWALADMVRMRCRIGEDEAAETVRMKLRATLDEVTADPEERDRLEARVGQLLGIGGDATTERAELFSAWRLFFERLAEQGPLAMVFEDMQWADESLLDFVEVLLDWSRNLPIFVLTLARPELLDKRPTWGAGMRHFGAVYLEPLSAEAMGSLLDGLVPGLPAALAEQIAERSAGVPLYAVETVRMLLDRGALVQEGSAYRVVGEVESLEVPETLHALIASRLDALPPEERQLLQDASILGKTFAEPALAALTEVPVAGLAEALAGLVRKEILAVQSDPRSPEHGQYGFLQDLVRHVAYETLSKRDRRVRHLAAADALASTMPEEEVAEVLAAHLAEAYALDPDARDADLIRGRARAALAHAAERASSLGAAAEASRYLVRASELCGDELERGELELEAGWSALRGGLNALAGELAERSHGRFETLGDRARQRRAILLEASLDTFAGRVEAARARLEPALAEAGGSLDATVAELEAMLGRVLALSDDPRSARPHLERAIDAAEALGLPEIFASAMTSRALSVIDTRPRESQIVLTGVLDFAEEHGLMWEWLRTLNNLGVVLIAHDRFDEALARIEEGIQRARRVGDRGWEIMLVGASLLPLVLLGRWDEAERSMRALQEITTGHRLGESMTLDLVDVFCVRGQIDEARSLVERNAAAAAAADDVQIQGSYALSRALLLRAEGATDEALVVAREALDIIRMLGANEQFNRALEAALDAATAAGDATYVAELFAEVDARPEGTRTPWLRAIRARFGALATGDAAGFAEAAEILRERGMRFKLAVVLLEHAEALVANGDGDPEPLLNEAVQIFEELRASVFLERAAALGLDRANGESAVAAVDVQT